MRIPLGHIYRSIRRIIQRRSWGYGRNINNRTRVNPQGPIGTIISETNSARSFGIIDSTSRTFYIVYRGLLWQGADKIESENHGGNNISENAERKNSFGVEKVGHKNLVIWYHKDWDSVKIDPNHDNSNQLIPADSTNVTSINDSENIPKCCHLEYLLREHFYLW